MERMDSIKGLRSLLLAMGHRPSKSYRGFTSARAMIGRRSYHILRVAKDENNLYIQSARGDSAKPEVIDGPMPVIRLVGLTTADPKRITAIVLHARRGLPGLFRTRKFEFPCSVPGYGPVIEFKVDVGLGNVLTSSIGGRWLHQLT